MTVVRFSVTPELFASLLSRQVARGYEDDVTKRTGAVWLHTDMGPSWYLTSDGRVLMDDVIDGTSLHEVEGRNAYAGLVLGAKTIQSPELLGLLPSMPSDAQTCPRCQGTRRWNLPVPDVDGRTHRILCPDCSGLGWVEMPARLIDQLIDRFLSGGIEDPHELRSWVEQHRALPLVFDMGGCYAIRPSGEVVSFAWDTPEDVVVELDERMRNAMLFRAAGRFPELQALVPQRPSGAIICD
jgi:hypothetical protein